MVWRFRLLVGLGVLLAVALAVLSLARVSFAGGPHLTYRKPAIWQSSTMLLVTQRTGFPEGRTTIPYTEGNVYRPAVPALGDIARFTTLAAVYAQLANSDSVLKMALRGTHIQSGTLIAVPQVAPDGTGMALPVMSLTGLTSSPEGAIELARRGTEALQRYITQQQTDANIPPDQRVSIQILSEPQASTVATGHKKTLPIAAFLGTIILTMGLAFVLENLRPAVRPVPVTEIQPRLPAERRTA